GCEPPPPPPPPPPRGPRFARGDCNGDGEAAGMADAVTLLAYNFLGGRLPECMAACDANGDAATGGTADAVHILAWRFLGGPPPAEPFPACGLGSLPMDASFGCERAQEGCR
ncbi:MAG: hypothetical protein HY721_34410, partial [Planctomycetes bacterium]|nr:hypothetical protein [Planctomycetota bacterium]